MKETLDEMSQLINGELDTVRTEMKELKVDSSRFGELDTRQDSILADFDKLQEKMEAIQTAVNRNETSGDAKTDDAANEYKEAFDLYLKTADESKLQAMESKLLSVGSDPDGGYVAPAEMAAMVAKIIYESSPIRNVANVMPTSKKEVHIMVDKDEAGAEWVSEQGTNTNSKTPQFGKIIIPVHKMATEPQATEEILGDAAMDMEGWLAGKVANKFARTENAAFVTGNGTGKPRGFTTYSSGTTWGKIEQVTTAASTVLDELDLIELMGALKDGYLPGATWAFSRQTNKVIRKLQDSNGNFLFTGQDLIDNTLFGYAITRMEDMAKPSSGSTYTAAALPVAFGNFGEAYTIVDREGLNVIRDPYTSKGFIKFYTTRRVGGDITNFEAIKLLKIKA